MHTQRYALSPKQRHQIHRLNNALRIAIPIPIDAPDEFDLALFVWQSLPRDTVVVTDAEETSLAIAPSYHPNTLGHILDSDHTHNWHYSMPVVIATVSSVGGKPTKVHPNPQWPGDLSLIYRDDRPDVLESHRC